MDQAGGDEERRNATAEEREFESGGGRILEPLMDREQRCGGGGQAEEHATEHDHALATAVGRRTGATTTTRR